jgi:MFS family permease
MSVVTARYRSMSAAVLGAGNTLIGAVIGPLVVGLVSDALNARYGAESLRYALLLTPIPVVIASALFWWAGTRYPREKAAAEADTE